jgi:TolA-binding protein
LVGAAALDLQRNEPKDIAAVLLGGAADFDVVPASDRRFTVLSDGVEVRVVGTKFRVDNDPTSHEVRVSVSHGVVEVRSPSEPGEVHRVAAGESWATHGRSAEAPAPSVSASASSLDSSAPVDSAAPTAVAAPASNNSEDAKSLFEAANRARRAGDVTRAMALYRDLTRKFPNDPRSKIAALELARLEMDKGNGSSEAEDALHRAASAQPGSVQEDALARLVQLYASKGDSKACQDARARYLAAYPNGVHVVQVRSACGSR